MILMLVLVLHLLLYLSLHDLGFLSLSHRSRLSSLEIVDSWIGRSCIVPTILLSSLLMHTLLLLLDMLLLSGGSYGFDLVDEMTQLSLALLQLES